MNQPIEALKPALRSAARALEVDLEDAQVDALLAYLVMLEKWNGVYNLTAVRDPVGMLTQHLADCLAVIPPLRRQLPKGLRRLMDVGSGGGLPGVVIALLLPEVQVTCVDTVRKKAAFVQQVAGELRLSNLNSVHSRVEELKIAPFDIVSSRAFASLPDFVRLTGKLLGADGVWLAMKGKIPDAEIAALPPKIDVFHVEQLIVPGLNAERCLVWMRPAAPYNS
jgi:16S rRNA (guanine527-N7)-methyltransferase